MFSFGTNTSIAKSGRIKIHIKHKLLNEVIDMELFVFTKISDLKQKLQKETKIEPFKQRIFFSNQELSKNNKDLDYYGIKKGSVLLLATKMAGNHPSFVKPLEAFQEGLSERFLKIIGQIETAFKFDIKPKLTENGTSGSYFLKNEARNNIAIFKPVDEEPYTPNNPKGYTGKMGGPGFRPGIRSGESSTREVAACLLDKKKYHGVPETTFVEIKNSFFYKTNSNNREENEEEKEIKVGSLQLFANHFDIVGNYGCMMFSVKEVHKIAILDIRILNCDRNEENILLAKVHKIMPNRNKVKNKRTNEFELIPIDHGLSFPDKISICSYEIVWMEWPQIQQPFTAEELEFIKNIDPKEDVKYLKSKLKFREICLRNFRIAETVLKKCAKNGLTLYQIGNILYKEDPDETSEIEKMIKETEDIYFTSKLALSHSKVLELIKKRKDPKKHPSPPSSSSQNHHSHFLPPSSLLHHPPSFLPPPSSLLHQSPSCSSSILDPSPSLLFYPSSSSSSSLLPHPSSSSILPSSRIVKDDNYAVLGGGKRRGGGVEEEDETDGKKLEGKWTRNYSNLAQISKMQQQEKDSYEIIEEDESDSDSDFGIKAKKVEVVRLVGKKEGEGQWKEKEGLKEDVLYRRMEEGGEWEKEEFDDLVRKWEEEREGKEDGRKKEEGGGKEEEGWKKKVEGGKSEEEGRLRRREKGKTVLSEKINGLSPIKKMHTYQNLFVNGYINGLKDHNENHNPHNLTRRTLKKMISLPNLWSQRGEEGGAIDEEGGGKDNEDGELKEGGGGQGRRGVGGEGNGKDEGGRRRGKKREKTIVYDEVFYYYFDHVLERYLMRMKNRKRLESTD